jgi:hypothetical protein
LTKYFFSGLSKRRFKILTLGSDPNNVLSIVIITRQVYLFINLEYNILSKQSNQKSLILSFLF